MLIRVCYKFMGCVEVRVPLIMSVKLNYPGIVNRTFGNWTQSNSIELNPWIEFDWFRQSDETERVPNFVWVRFPKQSNSWTNWTQSNSIHWIVLDWVRLRNSIKHSPMDCIGLWSMNKFAWSDCPLGYCALALVNLHTRQAHRKHVFLVLF